MTAIILFCIVLLVDGECSEIYFEPSVQSLLARGCVSESQAMQLVMELEAAEAQCRDAKKSMFFPPTRTQILLKLSVLNAAYEEKRLLLLLQGQEWKPEYFLYWDPLQKEWYMK